MFLVLFFLWSAHLTQLGRVFRCLGAVDDQNFGTMRSTTESLGVGTFPWGRPEGGHHQNVSAAVLVVWVKSSLLEHCKALACGHVERLGLIYSVWLVRYSTLCFPHPENHSELSRLVQLQFMVIGRGRGTPEETMACDLLCEERGSML